MNSGTDFLGGGDSSRAYRLAATTTRGNAGWDVQPGWWAKGEGLAWHLITVGDVKRSEGRA
jgi:hypothetical protein